MIEDLDVLVVGGGPAGSATAIRLALNGHSVAIVERGQTTTPDHYETLLPDIRVPLLELGAWDAFISDAHVPSAGTTSVWGSNERSFTDHMLSPFRIGWHVNRNRFDRMLLKRAEACGVRVRRNTRFLRLARCSPGWKVETQGNGRIASTRAKFIVDATGRHSVVARQLGATRRASDNLVALAGVCVHDKLSYHRDSNRSARLIVEAFASGWCYAVPAGDDLYCVVLVDGHDLPSSRSDRLSRWKESLQQTQLLRELNVEKTSSRFHVMLANTSRLSPFFDFDWAAVGDAAFAIDPLSGHGLMNSITGASAAAIYIIGCLNGENTNRERRERYQHLVNSKWQNEMEARHSVYRMEHRWIQSRFWQRRRFPTTNEPLTEVGIP